MSADVISPCPLPAYLGHAEPLAGGRTFHHGITVSSAGFTGVACIFVLYNVVSHLRYYTVPREQKLIVRMAILPAVYGLFSVFSIAFYGVSLYLEPISRIFEAVAICSLFELYVVYVSPSQPEQREVFFQGLERRGMFRRKHKHDKGSLRWFRVAWLSVFQFIPTTIATMISSEVTAAQDCQLAEKARLDTLIQRVVSAIFTGIAVSGVVAFYIRMRRDLKPSGATRKLVAFKLLVALVTFQTIIFSALAKSKVYRNTPHLSFLDWTYGVPAIFTSIEMVLFSILFAWAFTASPYRRDEPLSSYTDTAPVVPTKKLGFGRAILDVINISDIFKSVWIAMKILVRLPFGFKGLLKADRSSAGEEKRIPSESTVNGAVASSFNGTAVA